MSKAKKKVNVKSSKSAQKKTKKKRKGRTWHDDEFDAISSEARKIAEKYGKSKKKTSFLDDVLDYEASCSSSIVNGETEPYINVHRTHKVDFKEDIVPASWVCSLCGKGMAFEDLGDLFGPYYISTPRRVPDYLLPPKEPKLHVYQKKSRQPNFELWFHGSCALWASGLFLEGTEVPSLDEVVPKFWEQKCEICLKPGASIACDNVFLHFPCAKNNTKHYSLNASLFTCERVQSSSPGSPQL